MTKRIDQRQVRRRSEDLARRQDEYEMIAMRMLLLIMTLGCLGLSGCRTAPVQPKIGLPEDATAMKAEVAQHIPIGTAVEEAKAIMEESGFECSYSIGYNESPCLYCIRTRSMGLLVVRQWKVYIYHDGSAVTDIVASYGVVGT